MAYTRQQNKAIKIFRWIIFIPAFLLLVPLGTFFCIKIYHYIYNSVFQDGNGFSLFEALSCFGIFMAATGTYPMISFLIGNIAPNIKIGSIILFILYGSMIGMDLHYKYNLISNKEFFVNCFLETINMIVIVYIYFTKED
jgi:hypothetical protein